MKRSARKPKPGITRVDAEVRRLVARGARPRARRPARRLRRDRAGERMAEPELEPSAVGVDALRVSCPSSPSRVSSVTTRPGATRATGSRSGCQRLWAAATGSSQELPRPARPPASPRRSLPPSTGAARRAGAARGSRSSSPSRITGVTIWAASPPYAVEHAWNAGSSYAAAQSSCTTCRPRWTSRTTGWLGRCTERSSRSDATPGASASVDDGERLLPGQVAAQRHAARPVASSSSSRHVLWSADIG